MIEFPPTSTMTVKSHALTTSLTTSQEASESVSSQLENPRSQSACDIFAGSHLAFQNIIRLEFCYGFDMSFEH